MNPGSDLHGAAFLAGHRLGVAELSDTCETFCKDIATEKNGVVENFHISSEMAGNPQPTGPCCV